MAAGKFDRVLGGKKDRAPIEAFYSGREFAPLWVTDGAMSERGKAAAATIAGIEADGLDPADYPLPQIKAGADAETLAEAEIKFTDAVLTFVRHAQSGRVHYSRVHTDILYDLARTDPADVLAKLANASDVAAALDGYNPQQPQYKALKAKLAEVRRGNDIEKQVIPSGPVLKYGKDKKGKEEIMSDPRVPALRARFGMKSPEGDTNYDRELSGTIAKFQKEHGLQPTGQLTQATLDVINGPKRDKTVDIIVANMERWRWVPRDLGKTYVMVNIPDYTLRVMRDGNLVWKTRVVVGKPNLGDAADQRGDEVHHRQPDLERAALDHPERIPAGAAGGPLGDGAHRTEGRAGRRRHAPHLPAAGRPQRARPHPLQLPEQVPGVPARHAGQAPLRP